MQSAADLPGTWNITAFGREDFASANFVVVVDSPLIATAKCKNSNCPGFGEYVLDIENLGHYCTAGPKVRLTRTSSGVYIHESRECIDYYYPAPGRCNPHHIYTTKWKLNVSGNVIVGSIKDSVRLDETDCGGDCGGFGGWGERHLVFRGTRQPWRFGGRHVLNRDTESNYRRALVFSGLV